MAEVQCKQIGRNETHAHACKGAEVEKGLAVRGATAQNKRELARKAVAQWLGQREFLKMAK